MAKSKERQPEKVPLLAGQPAGRLFELCDWLAFAVVFAITLAVYSFTLAPTVTLEDSGELIVAAEYLGVPHPPGYPLWTMLAWLFQLIFSFKRYMGQPNPAWGVNFLSAFFGAATSGLCALLISRAGRGLLTAFAGGDEDRPSGGGFDALGCWLRGCSGVGAGLLLSFTPLQWSQSVIAEVYTLNTFIAILLLALSFAWLQQPQRSRIPYYIALLFGAGITNCQPIVLIVPPMMIMFFATDRDLFRDLLALGLVVLAVWSYIFRVHPMASDPEASVLWRSLWSGASLLMLLSPIAIWNINKKLFTEWRRVLIMLGCLLLGLSLFLYMPIASDQYPPPPMNWGYPRTWEGFKHAVTRGQYQSLAPAISPTAFLKQFSRFFKELEGEFMLPPLLAGLFPLFFIKRLRKADSAWLGAVFTGFVAFGVGMMMILNPNHDVQSLFIARVQLLQALAIGSLLIGAGFVFGLGFLSKEKALAILAMLIILLTPGLLFWKNAYDEKLIQGYGAANLDGFDLGWQFGCYQLRGAEGIEESLKPDEPPLPNPDYPPAMGQDAIFFGGTDPGRFVPTYMIFSAKVRPDVFLITQNALADNTYMSVMRDLYGDLIWIPTPQDSNMAFQSYVNDIRSGRLPQTAAVTVAEDGKVSVQGVQGVMEINGIICRMIFDANKHKHAFYIEESYVINWMYPYLEPHGLIMKLNNEPLPSLTPEMIRNDMEFWEWYTRRLLKNPSFCRSSVARKTFSKLRCAIAGVYAYRHLFEEAEKAFKQALELSPISPESNFRLADLYLQQGRFQDAYEVMSANLELDPNNEKIGAFIDQIKGMEQMKERMLVLQTALTSGTGTLDTVFELARLYLQSNRQQQFYELTRQLLANESIPPAALLGLAEMSSSLMPPRPDLVVEVLETYLRREPSNAKAWFELACVYSSVNNSEGAFKSLREAVLAGGEPIKELARKDIRLINLHNKEEFKRIVQPLAFDRGRIPKGFLPPAF